MLIKIPYQGRQLVINTDHVLAAAWTDDFATLGYTAPQDPRAEDGYYVIRMAMSIDFYFEHDDAKAAAEVMEMAATHSIVNP